MNSVISSNYIDNYFKSYVTEQYETRVEQIKNYAVNLLNTGSHKSMSSNKELDIYLTDPIVRIAIINNSGEIIFQAEDDMFNMHNNMMRGNMMGNNNRMVNTEDDYIHLENDKKRVGMLVITRNSTVQNSETVKLFNQSLFQSTIISGSLVLILAIVIIIYISTKMTKDLRQTARFAKKIETDSDSYTNHSKVLEIREIQTSLENLSSKLKLQKKVRQEKADQLSHEARTPLTILKTQCEGALDGIVDMDKSGLESCLNEINNLSNILSNINDVIEYSNGKVNFQPEKFDIINELKKIVNGLRLQFEKKGIDLELKGIDSIEITNDRSIFSQTIYNLLTNAYKFTEPGGQVDITVELQAENTLILQVNDTGIGIRQQDRNKIFKAYYRSPSVNTIQGEGLGLYIAKSNVETMGGKIYVKSRDKSGTSFIIEVSLSNNMIPKKLKNIKYNKPISGLF